MYSLLMLLLPVWTGSLVSAAPAVSRDVAQSGSDCTFSDAAQAMQKKTSCSTITLRNLKVPAGKTFDLSDLNEGTRVIFTGRTTFGYQEWEGPLISVSGTNIKISGSPGNLFDCQGQRWWDGKGSNGEGKKKPNFFNAHNLINSEIRNLNVLNTPVHAFSISGSENLGIFNVNIDDSAGDTQGGHNTDGFDVGTSNGVTISGCSVRNQDDCLAINSGTNITFVNGFCSGGHGLSIGSVGGRSSNIVKGVHISNSKVTKSMYGIRVKTIAGAQGAVSDVVYDNISMSEISDIGIVVQQDYKNGRPTGNPTTGVPITNLTVNKVTGSVKPGGTNVHILCGSTSSCNEWKWTDNKIVDGTQNKVNSAVPAGVVL
ncbi:hypothetical protein E4U30_001853 [Claviceps sp. LM220 group G6]|nr:hypothetical protein E4U30_001853 [Claviceps sp. LM220 group G6]KAG6103398.1 hypothetical protein E4U31_002803 [Claviceps sp. LM219 group G6]KAG6104178.1 hypothetical protein E4U14_005875 [Claviceps sp. LM454 group G7]